MFSSEYPHLLETFQEVAKLVACLKATLADNDVSKRPEGFDVWAVAVAGYAQVVIHVTVCLSSHPEWAEELDRLLKPIGCPAQRLPLITEFLQKKGAKPDEGIAMLVS